MTYLRPASWAEALAARAEHPEAVVVAGGTDVMVEINFGRLHPPALLDLSRVGELRALGREDGHVRVGSGVTYQSIMRDLPGELPGLAAAARTVGSPPIRNRGTIGGNLGSASPAGDCHPPLLASGAEVEIASVRASRTVPIAEYFVGPKRSVLGPDELIAAVWVPAATGPQTFSKVGSRNAMVIAICSFALALHPGGWPGRHRDRLRRAGAAAGPRRRGVPRRASRRDEGLGIAGPAWATPPSRSSPVLLPEPPGRSTTCGAPPTTAGTPSGWSHGDRSSGAGTSSGEAGREGLVDRQRDRPCGRRRRGAREPPPPVAGTPRSVRHEERLRAG